MFSCAMGTGDVATASCGDYLYKPGKSKTEMAAPMEQHGEPECNQHRRVPPPLAPTTYPKRQNDHFVQTVQVDSDSERGTWNKPGKPIAMLGMRHGERIDRPPKR
ncbi:MAG: hypothetical protein AB8G99_09655 [Planctomycetaceae bacterium]